MFDDSWNENLIGVLVYTILNQGVTEINNIFAFVFVLMY